MRRCREPELAPQEYLERFPQYRTAAPNLPTPFDFPYPEDADSIQYTIALVMRSLMNGTIDGAVLLFNCDSPAPVEAFVANDPYVLNGLVTRWRVRVWTTVVGEGVLS